MKNLIEAAKKYKALEMAKQYQKAGVLFFAVTEFLRLGTSKLSLELLRETVNLKVQRKLRQKHGHILEMIPNQMEVREPVKKIWICWFQGLDDAPDLVKKCVMSAKHQFEGYEVVILTEKNLKDYVTFPAIIEERVARKEITLTHLSDLLRLELLIKYGGIWIDSTVWFSGGQIAREILEADLFMFQELKPGSDGHCLPISSWFMVAKPGHPILLATRALLYDYWNNQSSLIDYFLIHHFINISKEYFTELWKQVPRYSNSLPHLLLLELFEPYSEERLTEIYRLTSIHKLSYKFTEDDLKKPGTYYRHLF